MIGVKLEFITILKGESSKMKKGNKFKGAIKGLSSVLVLTAGIFAMYPGSTLPRM